jgi:hypothetical protein
MRGILRHTVFCRALGLLLQAALTLFFLALNEGVSLAAPADFDYAITGYVTRMMLALLLLGAVGYGVAKFLPRRFGAASRGHIKIIAALSLGRDIMYIVQTGPHVVAFLTGRTGAVVLNRWSVEEWEDYDAASSFAANSVHDEKKAQ